MNKRLKKFAIASIVSSLVMTSAYASVSCPNATDIKDANKDLNAVIRMSKKGFFVLTAQPAVDASNHSWIVVSQATGTGFDDAYNSGVTSVKSVFSSMNPDAIEQGGAYICAYMTSSGGVNVMAVAQQQQGFIFNPSVINFDSVKAMK